MDADRWTKTDRYGKFNFYFVYGTELNKELTIVKASNYPNALLKYGRNWSSQLKNCGFPTNFPDDRTEEKSLLIFEKYPEELREFINVETVL